MNNYSIATAFLPSFNSSEELDSCSIFEHESEIRARRAEGEEVLVYHTFFQDDEWIREDLEPSALMGGWFECQSYYLMAETASGKCFVPHLEGVSFFVKGLEGLYTLNFIKHERGNAPQYKLEKVKEEVILLPRRGFWAH